MSSPRPPVQPKGFGLATRGLPSEVELDRAAALGFDRVEFGLRWDQHRVLDACARRCEQARDRGLEPVVMLDVGGNSRWVGLGAPVAFARWAEEAVAVLSACHRWSPVARPNVHARRQYLDGKHRSTGHFLRALDHQLAAHVLAAGAVTSAIPDASFTFEIGSEPLYETDGLLLDILVAPAAGIDRSVIGEFLRERRTQWYRAADADRTNVPPNERLRRRISRSVIPLEQALPRAIAATYEADGPTVHRVRRDAPAINEPAIPLDQELDEANPTDRTSPSTPNEASVLWTDTLPTGRGRPSESERIDGVSERKRGAPASSHADAPAGPGALNAGASA